MEGCYITDHANIHITRTLCIMVIILTLRQESQTLIGKTNLMCVSPGTPSFEADEIYANTCLCHDSEEGKVMKS